jgi:3-oxoacyl-[acyl-carrier protein] reductase
MHIHFANQTVIVTGAAHGFGRAIAINFAARGAHVWACDVLGDELIETQRLCQEAGGVCHVRTVDVTDEQQVNAMVAEALALAPTQQIDVLVNNAGGVRGQVGQPLEQVTLAQWHAIMDVNLTAAFICSRAVVPSMKAATRGRIINISSGAGLGPSLTGIQAYASAKAGQINFTRQLCHELGPFNITANNLALALGLLGTSVGPTQPSTPANGQLWVDTSSNPPLLKVWNGATFTIVSFQPGASIITSPSGTAPSSPALGQLWQDTSQTPDELKMWDGTNWVRVDPDGIDQTFADARYLQITTAASTYLAKAGGTMTGNLTLVGNPSTTNMEPLLRNNANGNYYRRN